MHLGEKLLQVQLFISLAYCMMSNIRATGLASKQEHMHKHYWQEHTHL